MVQFRQHLLWKDTHVLTMEKLKNTYDYLKGYQHVADFQRFCGIKIIDSDCVASSTADAGGSLHSKNNTAVHKHGVDYALKQRNVCEDDKNSIEIKGQVQSTAKNGIKIDYSNTKLAYKIENRLLHLILSFGAGLGGETFYLTFFPFMCWNLDNRLCRQIVLMWHVLMYFGQVMKDYVRWPRPGPPAVRLEERFDMEFGMPSTHTIVGTCVPFSLLILTSRTYEYPFYLGLIAAITWSSLVAFSRVYLGMHTALDVLAGIIWTAFSLPWFLMVVEYLDYVQVTSPYAPIFIFLIPLLSCVYYPEQKQWSITLGDTCNVMSLGAGMAMSSWFTYQVGWLTETPRSDTLLPLPVPTLEWAIYSVIRIIIGVAVLAMLLGFLKKFYFKIIILITGVDRDDIQTHRKLRLEVPFRWLQVGTITLTAMLALPLGFSLIGINRPGFWTEL